MSHYKKDVASNRDALFGGGGGGSSRPSAPRASRPQQQQQQRPATTSSSLSSVAKTTTTPISSANFGYASADNNNNNTDPTITPGPSKIFTTHGRLASKSVPLNLLTGTAKIDKMAEAEDYRLKAKKAMTRGIFSKPDPISASNYYKRAADAYKQCGENRLERLHRIASGDCQMGQDAYATAASEYTRAAELAEISDETINRKRQECHKLHLDAANAWQQMGEKGRAAESTVKAAFGLIMGDNVTAKINDKALQSIEEAIELFVGDPLNKKCDYRRTGVSIYADTSTEATITAEAKQLASQNIITDSYAHETLFKIGGELIKRRQYESALYAYGAGTASLEHEGYATVSLSRAYVTESIVTLAMGDTVAASKDFQNVHLQSTQYLSSRECALEEDLIRACNDMDGEALDEARGRNGPHRAALANLDTVLRELVGEIRVSGRVKKDKTKASAAGVTSTAANTNKGAPTSAVAAAVSKEIAAAIKPSPLPERTGKDLEQDTNEAFSEMDDIMNQMGLGDDDNGDEDDDDDDIDLT